LQREHGQNTCGKQMGLNVWNNALEAKYKISLEHGKEDMSISLLLLSLAFRNSTFEFEFTIKQSLP